MSAPDGTHRARLLDTRVPSSPEGVVLVLHGGANRPDDPMVRPTQLSVLRMIPVARRIARAGRGRLAVLRLLNSARGWDAERTPVADVQWALGLVRERFGDLPVGLVGHSLGGRAALLAGNEPSVRSVVALNPWVYATDSPSWPVAGCSSCTAPRTGSPTRPGREAVVHRMARSTDVEYVEVAGGKHAMLHHGAEFERAAAEFITETLLDTRPRPGGARP